MQEKQSRIAGIAAAVGLGVFALVGTGGAARAQIVYASTDTGNFGTLNLNTGVFSQSANFSSFIGSQSSGSTSLFGIARLSANGQVYGIDDNNVLYQINTSNNSIAVTGQFALNGNQTLRSIAFDNTTGTFYGLASTNFTAADATLYQLSTTASGATALSNLGFTSRGGLAIVTNGSTTTGFATQGTSGNDVFRFALTSGATATDLGVAGFTNPVSALANIGGQLNAVDKLSPNTPATNNTYRVNQTTGAATLLGNYNPATFGNILSITDTGIAANIPEPGTAGLLAMGLTMGTSGVIRRRRKHGVGSSSNQKEKA